jgi:hypothetical protein
MAGWEAHVRMQDHGLLKAFSEVLMMALMLLLKVVEEHLEMPVVLIQACLDSWFTP